MTKTKTVEQPAAKKERSLAVDRFRGFAIFLVVITLLFGLFVDIADDMFGDQLATTLPFMAWVAKLFGHHAADGIVLIPNYSIDVSRAGLSLADLFAPMFLFIVGLTLVRSFKSREEKVGTKAAYLHLATRFLGLIGIGTMLNGLENWMEVLAGEKFASFDFSGKVAMIGFIVGIAFVIITLLISLFKNKKLTAIFAKIMRYVFAVVGVMAVFFIIVRGAEYLSGNDLEVFGGNNWDILQNIGLAGLVALPFVKMGKWGRLVIVGLMLGVFSIFLTYGGTFVAKAVSKVIEGGVFGCVGAASIVLLGSVFEDFKKNIWFYIGLIVVLLGLGLWLSLGPKMLLTKRGATPNFAMITAGVAAIVYGVISLFDKFKPKFAFFTWWGSNSILTYTSAYILAILISGVIIITETLVPVWASIVIAVVLLALFTIANWALHRKQKYISL